MKGSLVAIGIVLSAVCHAQHCPDPRLRQAAIGGDTIEGFVLPHHKPLKFAEVRLLFSNGKTARVGTTDNEGGFHFRHLRPDTYLLVVQGWGSTTIRISADLTKDSMGQMVSYTVQLLDSECIGTMASSN